MLARLSIASAPFLLLVLRLSFGLGINITLYRYFFDDWLGALRRRSKCNGPSSEVHRLWNTVNRYRGARNEMVER